MKNFSKSFFLTVFASIFFVNYLFAQPQIAKDNFEGNSTINTWTGDDCQINTSFTNPYPTGINTSTKVLKYADLGGLYANVSFDAPFNLNLSASSQFTFKLYVPSSGITGSANNQVSLKLQNGSLPSPWLTQSEVIKPIVLNQWQVITIDFATDPYINLNPSSPNPIDRSDFNRVLIQVNGENNNANVLAFIDDFSYTSAFPPFKDLVWSDEFGNNGAVNNSNWYHQTQLPNGTSWYNGELQHYTNSQSNSFVSNGMLNIVAKKETFTNQGQTKQYTSARLNSKFAFKYGRVEVRAKLPEGAGTWPAIWMLGKNINEPGGYWAPTFGNTNWPVCGEIDIMEHWGSNQNVISSAAHFPVNGNLNAGQYVTNAQYKAGVSSNFHVYAVEWTEQKIVFSVDGVNHLTYNPSVKNQYTWPFNAEQYILLNVAVEPSVADSFTQSAMEIDYVRVYQDLCVNTSSSTNFTACNSYTWNGVTYTTSGAKTFTTTNTKGCDSTATLNLTINTSTSSSTNLVINRTQLPYTWNGLVFNAAGSQTKTGLINAKGCDSTATLILTVSGSPQIVGGNSVCVGSSIQLTTNVSGGVWSSVAGRATVSATGLVTGTSGGSAKILYTAGSVVLTKIITVNAIPGVPSILYAGGYSNPQAGCTGGVFGKNRTFGLLGNPSGGTWLTSGPITINSSGIATTSNTNGSGFVTYTFTNSNGCSSSRTITGLVGNCAGKVNSTNFDATSKSIQWSVYPNPAKDIINIKFENFANGNIIITDIYGKVLKTQLTSLGNNSIEVSALTKGTYFITVVTEQNKQTKKIIIE